MMLGLLCDRIVIFGLSHLPLSHCHRPPLSFLGCPSSHECYHKKKLKIQYLPPVRTGGPTQNITNSRFAHIWFSSDNNWQVSRRLSCSSVKRGAGLLKVRTPIICGQERERGNYTENVFSEKQVDHVLWLSFLFLRLTFSSTVHNWNNK